MYNIFSTIYNCYFKYTGFKQALCCVNFFFNFTFRLYINKLNKEPYLDNRYFKLLTYNQLTSIIDCLVSTSKKYLPPYLKPGSWNNNCFQSTSANKTGRIPYFTLFDTIKTKPQGFVKSPQGWPDNTRVKTKRANIACVHIYPLVHFKYIALK